MTARRLTRVGVSLSRTQVSEVSVRPTGSRPCDASNQLFRPQHDTRFPRERLDLMWHYRSECWHLAMVLGGVTFVEADRRQTVISKRNHDAECGTF